MFFEGYASLDCCSPFTKVSSVYLNLSCACLPPKPLTRNDGVCLNLVELTYYYPKCALSNTNFEQIVNTFHWCFFLGGLSRCVSMYL